MHTDYDTQTVTNTLALYGVTRQRTAWMHRVHLTLAGTAGLTFGTVAGHIVKGVMGW